MKLLFDHNLSPRLAEALGDLFPGSAHVRNFGLHTALDGAVWDHAEAHGFVIVSKDSDFHQRSFLHGAPPKVIWVRLGNCTTQEVEALIRARAGEIQAFGGEAEEAFLVLARS